MPCGHANAKVRAHDLARVHSGRHLASSASQDGLALLPRRRALDNGLDPLRDHVEQNLPQRARHARQGVHHVAREGALARKVPRRCEHRHAEACALVREALTGPQGRGHVGVRWAGECEGQIGEARVRGRGHGAVGPPRARRARQRARGHGARQRHGGVHTGLEPSSQSAVCRGARGGGHIRVRRAGPVAAGPGRGRGAVLGVVVACDPGRAVRRHRTAHHGEGGGRGRRARRVRARSVPGPDTHDLG
mmetsp:Transcript_22577/g.70713  ORF Transcript_22577/g.70713 Transcript_22577/m.70713 type:complete len:248 (-) Transcript_22577:3138-3881(-)